MSWWRHVMETVPGYLWGGPPVPAGFPSQIASNTELWCFIFPLLNKPLHKPSSCRWFVMCPRRSRYPPGRDLMRERTRSRIQYGGRQMRHVNTVLFLPFYWCFRTRWRIKFDIICALLSLGGAWKLTHDARLNLIWCTNVHCIKPTDARTNMKMRERMISSPNKRSHRLLASLRYFFINQYWNMSSPRSALD